MTQKPGTGTVIVKRDPAFYGSGCSYRLFANGAPFADVNRGEKVQIYLPSGEHILGAKANGLCGGGNPETSFTLGAGQTRIFRVGVEASGDVKLHPTAF
jgi:hypothetical protein